MIGDGDILHIDGDYRLVRYYIGQANPSGAVFTAFYSTVPFNHPLRGRFNHLSNTFSSETSKVYIQHRCDTGRRRSWMNGDGFGWWNWLEMAVVTDLESLKTALSQHCGYCNDTPSEGIQGMFLMLREDLW